MDSAERTRTGEPPAVASVGRRAREGGWIGVLAALALLLAACQGTLVALETPTPAERTPTLTRPPFLGAGGTAVPARMATEVPMPVVVPSPTVTARPPEVSPAPSPVGAPTPGRRPTPPSGISAPTVASTPVRPVLPTPTASPTPVASPTAVGSCDLALDKTMLPLAGSDAVLVTLTLQNRGDGPCAPGTVAEDQLPEGMHLLGTVTVTESGGSGDWACIGARCVSAASLPPAYAATVTFTVKGEPGQVFENCALVSALAETDSSDNRSCVSFAAPPSPTPPSTCLFGFDKAMALSDSVSVTSGRRATVTLRIQNVGPEGCQPRWSAVRVVDVLPEGMTATGVPRADDPGWGCVTSERALQCEGPPPMPGRAVTVTGEVVVTERVGGVTEVTNCATLDPVGATACATVRRQ
ncbi:MAG: hypothetical protein RMH81_07800 [Thermomicrobium sp.]|nr:hypothetical protein [Thermomicrobium sp.]